MPVINRIRTPALVVALEKRPGRPYVPPRFVSSGGAAVSERLTAMDVEKQEFRRKMRGLDPEHMAECEGLIGRILP